MKRFPLKHTLLLLLICFFTFAGIYGCSSQSSDDSGKGQITIGLTDAAGDFITYTVDVLSLSLTHANGTVIETLPLATRVDFAQYVDMTEFVTAANVPLGAYKKATLTLDYSDADIRVENSDGEIITVSTLVDEDDSTLSVIEMDVYLENRSSLVVAPGLLSHMTLDFDLTASNSVAFDDEGLAHVTVAPTLLAEVNHESPKTFRLRGTLDEVLPDQGHFFVNVSPFYHRIHQDRGLFGRLMVVTGDDTVYEINEETLTGTEGLARLAEQEAGVSIIAKGKMKTDPCRFEAAEVFVGTSVPGNSSDYVTGNVLSRAGNILSVNGMIYIKNESRFIMNDTVSVTVSDDTPVRKQGEENTLSIDALAPGQRVMISGTIRVNETDTMDMDAAMVRMVTTVLRGHVADNTDTACFNVRVNSMSMQPIELFDFEGTGQTVEDDADPTNYQIETGGMDLSARAIDDAVKIRGFVNAFGQAPCDFLATTIEGIDDRASFYKLHWKPFTREPFTRISEEELEVNLTNTDTFHHLGSFLALLSLQSLEQAPTIIPGQQGVYVIIMRGGPQVYTDFGAFTSGLEQMLDRGNRAKKLFVTGVFDADAATLAARYLTLSLD